MLFLPIADRELRVACRKKATYIWRLGGALIFLVVSICIFVGSAKTSSASGLILHTVLSWITFVGCALAGVFFTADCLSEERAEGTLGLLFLAELRGYDVVLGKLVANSLQAFYTMVAALPILALPLVMGGVSGTVFCKTMLALLNTLWFSLSLGIFISSFHRDSQSAMGITLLVLVLMTGPPLADLWVPGPGTGTVSPVGYASPALSLLEASAPGFKAGYWLALAIPHAAAWIFLAAASFITPRVWTRNVGKEKKPRTEQVNSVSAETRLAFRREWLEKSPITWMLLRNQVGGSMLLWCLLAALGYEFLFLLSSLPAGGFGILYGISAFLFQFFAVSQAVKFFAEGRKTGSLELILCAPMSEREIVWSQVKALVKLFQFPFLLLIFVHTLSILSQLGSRTLWSTEAKNVLLFQLIAGPALLIVGTLALVWFGTWAGLKSKKPARAVLETFGCVYILPWIIIMIAQFVFYLFVAAGMFFKTGTNSYWWQVVLSFAISLGCSLFFIKWSKHRLFTRLREVASGAYSPAKQKHSEVR